VKAVVLVGGEGTRLRPLTSTTPKPLLPIALRPFLERQLTWLGGHGVDEVVLSLGYLPDRFVEHFRGDRFGSVRLRYAVEPYPLGTAGAIRFAADAAGIGERFIVCNGDVLTTLDLTALTRFHADSGAEATIHLTRVEDPSAFGVVPTYPDGEVKAFVEKPPRDAAPTDWINAGTYVLEPSMLQRIPVDLNVSIERETFPRMLEERGCLFARGTDDYWIDIGTADTYLRAHADAIVGKLGMPPVPEAHETASGVWVHGSAHVEDGALVEAPALLGGGVTIAKGARVAASTIGPGCAIGRDAVVEASVLLDGARLATGAHVQASILGSSSMLDDGAAVIDGSIVGAGGRVAARTTLVRGRVPVPAAAG
jgi:mannose-1-phosphate guanylyltransferase